MATESSAWAAAKGVGTAQSLVSIREESRNCCSINAVRGWDYTNTDTRKYMDTATANGRAVSSTLSNDAEKY
ncbi:hypothetical protein [Merismopedia glauca]|uniref:hypothetical protein n=1 Tax=Merismopedia glauca TaxID=292586 RepID=UPI0011B28A2F|nr:hypothetical protein [Merismopedia glauca]